MAADVSMAMTDESVISKQLPGDQSINSQLASAKKKKTRHRNRKLYSDILRQMEFYFSDSNLHKDKFLQRNMQQPDGWVQVDLFADFKKIKAITADKRVLIRALSKSTFLELSGDGKQIRRKQPYVSPNNEEVDQRTVYLEPLPLEADHAFVTNLLKPGNSGRILYVSLPRFKRSGQLKGFAFVEFDSVPAAEKACETFSPSRLPSPSTETAMIGKFPQTNKQLESLMKKRSSGTNSELASPSTTGPSLVQQQQPTLQKRPSRNRTTSTSTGPEEQPQAPLNSNEPSVPPPPLYSGISNNNKFWVISKKRWLELKREYLDLQKQRIAALKQVVEGKNPTTSVEAETTTVKPANKTGGRKRKQQGDIEQPAASKAKHIKFDDEDENEQEELITSS